MEAMEEQRRYPIGRFAPPKEVTSESRSLLIEEIPQLVRELKEAIEALKAAQSDPLNYCYRPGGWTVRQIVHHMADNDMNAYIRFKRALTEDGPRASSYREDLWAELADGKEMPIEHSLMLIEVLHSRFYYLLKALRDEQFERTLVTEVLGSISLDAALQRFIWHNRHHIAHIRLGAAN